jgi:Prokaryotic homologs of the JAB domain
MTWRSEVATVSTRQRLAPGRVRAVGAGRPHIRFEGEMRSRLVTAVKAGRVLVDGEWHAILPGKTKWNGNVPELRDPAVAALFGLSNGRSHGQARRSRGVDVRTSRKARPAWSLRSAAPARHVSAAEAHPPLPRPPLRRVARDAGGEACDLRDTIAPHTVVLPRHVRDELQLLGFGTGYEACGAFFGKRTPETIVIHEAINASEGSFYGTSRHHARLDWERIKEIQRARHDSHRWLLLGSWHSHEHFTGERATPSDDDLWNWSGCVDKAAAPFLGLIVHPSLSGDSDARWLWPNYSAWVARRNENGALVIEPANLELEQ